MHSQGSGKMYQPDPFGSQVAHVRGDCSERYNCIKDVLGDVSGKSVLDFGCAEGYFGFRLLQDGADTCDFIDTDIECLRVINQRAINHGFIDHVITDDEIDKTVSYDIILCLDLWSEPSVPSVEDFHAMCEVLVISTSGNGDSKNGKLLDELGKRYNSIEVCYSNYQGRKIFVCRND